MEDFNVFNDYLASIAKPEQRARVEEVLRWVHTTFPGLKPHIGWNQPMFTDHGTFIIGFSIAKPNLAVSPEVDTLARFAEEVRASGYTLTQMLFRIRWEQPVDYALLERIIAFNIEDKADCKTFWRK